MRNLLVTFAVIIAAGVTARAADLKDLNRATEAFNAGNYTDAALGFFKVAEEPDEDELGQRAEYFLALTLTRLELYQSALGYDLLILEQGAKHPYYIKAIENMLDLMEAMDDKAVIPSALDKEYNDAFGKLPPAVISRVNFVIALWTDKANKKEDSADFLKEVAKDSAWYPRARYLQGVQAASAAFKAGANEKLAAKLDAQAAAAFDDVLKMEAAEKRPYRDLPDLKQLATIALARLRYSQGKYAESLALYDAIPRFSRHWRDSLFEGAYAAFMNDELGRALGMLHTLHAPTIADQMVPESWLLTSYIYFFSCLFDESKSVLATLQKVYPEISTQLGRLIEQKREKEFYYQLLTQNDVAGTSLPTMVRNELLTDERLRTRRAYIKALEQELEKLRALEAFRKSGLQAYLLERADTQRNIMIQVAGQTVLQQMKQIKVNLESFDGAAEIVRFEMAKKEKELLESNFDQEGALGKLPLERPKMPEKGIEYWSFEGEYWPDELGYYRYTVKNACPVEKPAESGEK